MKKKTQVGTSDIPVRQEVYGATTKRPRPSHQWWKATKDDIAEGVFAVVNDLDKVDNRRVVENLNHARLYGNREIMGTRPGQHNRTAPGEPGKPSRVTYNVISSMVDTATSKIGQSRPKPLFDTENGNPSMRTRARWLTKYVAGVFYDGKAYPEGLKVFRDACIFGTGVMHMAWDKDSKGRARLRFERVLPDEILVDDNGEGRYGEPQQLHRRKWILRERLIEMFPQSENEIRSARGEGQSFESVQDSDGVETIESWHLPSSHESGDGRHTICISGHTLFSESWDLQVFPFSFFHWNDPIVGFWGQGLAFALIGIQLEINRLCRDISSALRLVAQPRVFVEAGSQVVPSHLNPGNGDRIPVVKYMGRKPEFQTAQAMSNEVYAERDRWIKLAYEVTGINQLNASGKKPAGIESGEALRVYNDQASERFVTTSQRWEEFYMDVSRKVIALSKARYEAGDKKLSVLTPAIGRDKFIKQVKWSEVDLDADKYVMKSMPVNPLGETPAGKEEKVLAWLKAGLIDQSDALAELDRPDPDAYVSLKTASLELTGWIIEEILDNGKTGYVEELSDLKLALKMGMASVLRAEREGYSDDAIDRLRRWVDQIQDALAPPASSADVPGSSQIDPSGGSPVDPMGGGGPLPSPDPGLLGVPPVAADSALQGGAMTVSDPHAKQDVHSLSNSAPAQMMKSLEGGVSFRYKPGVPGEDPGDQKFGITTQQLKETPMGRSFVVTDPQTGYEAVNVKEAIGPLLASTSNLDMRLRQLEGEPAASANDAVKKGA